ncbi:MAG TPA: diheme cytochrome c [Burkholderiales bacterium]|nr:diheme cytochrome c [Burkholderiales bacterium]
MNHSRRRLALDLIVWTVSLLAGLALLAHEALADGHRYSADNARWKAECGSCHLAYPPQLLPAPAWRGIMAGLDKHFGTDASLDPAAAAEIGAFLERNAGRGRRANAQTLRISESAWFRHEHDEVPAAAWKRPSVTSAANCSACHRAAERGDFSERNIRIPR